MLSEEILGPGLKWEDTLAIALCIITAIIVALVASAQNRGSLDGYFLASRNTHWIPVGLSIFVSNIGIEHFVGVVGAAARDGIAIGLFEIEATLIMPILGWIFMPVYIASGVSTMPEYIQKRFGGRRLGLSLALISLLVYIFTKIATVLYAGTIFVTDILNWNKTASLFMLVAVAALCTFTGGLTAVIWTDVLQALLMIVGTVTLTIYGFDRIGGYDVMTTNYTFAVDPGPPNATNWTGGTCSSIRPNHHYMNLWQPSDSDNMPGPGYIGAFIIGLWYLCTDQVIVQRALASKNFTHAKAGTVLAGFLKTLPLFTLVFPGVISRILNPEIIACATPERCEEACGRRAGCADMALPLLVYQLFPKGLRGFFFGVTLAALTSSLTSIFNSSSTIITLDIWQKLRKSASNKELMIVGRVTVLLMVAASVLWVLVLNSIPGDDLFHSIQKTSAFLTPPIAAMFLAAIFWKRATETGVFYGFMVGMILGIVRMAFDYSYPTPHCNEPDTRPKFLTQIHYLYYTILVFGVSGFTIVILSHLTDPINDEHLHRLTFQTRHHPQEPVPWPEKQRSVLEDDVENGPILAQAAPMATDRSHLPSSSTSSTAPVAARSSIITKKLTFQSPCVSIIYPAGNDNINIDNNHRAETASGSEIYQMNEPNSPSNFSSTKSAVIRPDVLGNSTSGCKEAEAETSFADVDFSLDENLNAMADQRYITEEEQKRESEDYAQRIAGETFIRKATRLVFGINQKVRSTRTHLSEHLALERHKSLAEDPRERWACNIAALLLLALGVFLHIYWSVD